MLQGRLAQVGELKSETISQMFELMDRFYENMDYSAFKKDLAEKDQVILLSTQENNLAGFSTLKYIELEIDNRRINGVFSGDTIIHKDHWGSTELFRTFSKAVIPKAQEYEHFYWFLISKGYKTYQMLPLFFRNYYPSLRADTPEFEQKVMAGYAKLLYGDQYNKATGVLNYTQQKDYLKEGVADAEEIRSGNKHARFFLEKNPTYNKGTDLVCLASLKAENMRPSVLRMVEL